MSLITGGMMMVSPVLAEDPLNLEFKGTLVEPPPCSLDDSGTILVEFGDHLAVNRVASGLYRRPVPITLACEHDDSGLAWQLTLSVTGTPALFDADNAAVLTPEQSSLGVKLYIDNQPFELNKSVKINSTTPPSLEAVLIQADGTELAEGPFTAQATLRAAYQ